MLVTISYEKKFDIEVIVPELTDVDVIKALHQRIAFVDGKQVINSNGDPIAIIKNMEFTEDEPAYHNWRVQ